MTRQDAAVAVGDDEHVGLDRLEVARPASGATVGACLVSTAAFSRGTSATMRASRSSAVKNSDWNCVTSSPASTRLSSSSASACRVTTTLTR